MKAVGSEEEKEKRTKGKGKSEKKEEVKDINVASIKASLAA